MVCVPSVWGGVAGLLVIGLAGRGVDGRSVCVARCGWCGVAWRCGCPLIVQSLHTPPWQPLLCNHRATATARHQPTRHVGHGYPRCPLPPFATLPPPLFACSTRPSATNSTLAALLVYSGRKSKHTAARARPHSMRTGAQGNMPENPRTHTRQRERGPPRHPAPLVVSEGCTHLGSHRLSRGNTAGDCARLVCNPKTRHPLFPTPPPKVPDTHHGKHTNPGHSHPYNGKPDY